MVTRLGPAVITLTLDTKAALAQLDALKRRLAEMGQLEVERREKEKDEKETEKEEVEKKAAGGGGNVWAKIAAMSAVLTASGIMAERAFALTAGAFGTGNDFISKAIEQKFHELEKKTRDMVTNLTASFPASRQLFEIERGRMLLGEKAPEFYQMGDLWKTLFEVNKALQMAERTKTAINVEVVGAGATDMIRKIAGGLFK